MTSTPEPTSCIRCAFEGEAPADWWHVPRGERFGGGTEDDRICDLCWRTLSEIRGDIGDALRTANYVGNRILEVLRSR